MMKAGDIVSFDLLTSSAQIVGSPQSALVLKVMQDALLVAEYESINGLAKIHYYIDGEQDRSYIYKYKGEKGTETYMIKNLQIASENKTRRVRKITPKK